MGAAAKSAQVGWLRNVDCVPDGVRLGQDPWHCSDLFSSLAATHAATVRSGSNVTVTSNEEAGIRQVVDGVILVHYSRAPCRKEAALVNLRHAGLPWQPGPSLHIAEHLDADDLTDQFMERCIARLFCTEMEISQASCTANHVYAWHLALSLDWATTLILEDDAHLPAHFSEHLGRRLHGLPAGWWILNFGCATTPAATGSRACSRAYVLSRVRQPASQPVSQTVSRSAGQLASQSYGPPSSPATYHIWP